VAQKELHHGLGVGEAGRVRPTLDRGLADQVHVAADAGIGAADEAVDAVALDHVEEVAGQGRLGEEGVETAEVGLAGLKRGHAAGVPVSG
jgi:hypothetical protein